MNTRAKQLTLGVVAVAVVIGGYFLLSNRPAAAGPYGGDLVPIDDGAAYAEVLANAETGGVMAHIWDKDLKTARPISSEPLVIGSGDDSVELAPHPTGGDPAGACSRFYGQADWVRGEAIHYGWLRRSGEQQQFVWKECWTGGRSHGGMWNEVESHRRMGMANGQNQRPGHGGPGHHRGTGGPAHHGEANGTGTQSPQARRHNQQRGDNNTVSGESNARHGGRP